MFQYKVGPKTHIKGLMLISTSDKLSHKFLQ